MEQVALIVIYAVFTAAMALHCILKAEPASPGQWLGLVVSALLWPVVVALWILRRLDN